MNPRLRNPGVGLLALAVLWVALYWASGPGASRVPVDELDESGAVLVRQSEPDARSDSRSGGAGPDPRNETPPETRRGPEPQTVTREPTPPPPVGGTRSPHREAEPDRAPAPPPEPEYETYTVRSGDSLSEISQRLYGSARHWRFLYEANRDRIPDPDRLRVGTELRVPPLPDGG